MIVLDTSVLVYAVGAPHPLARPARALLAAITLERVRATTTMEVIHEFAHVRSRRRSRADAAALAREFASGLAPLISTNAADLEAGLEIFEASDLGAFDAVLAGAVVARELEGLVSADAGFASVPGLPALRLGGGELDRMLR